MKISRPLSHHLRRLTWIVLVASVLLASVGEIYRYWRGISDLPQLIIWLAGTAVLVTVLIYTFRQVNRLQQQAEKQLEQSQALARQQAALLHLSAQLSATLDPEKISRIVKNNLQDNLGYQTVEIHLADNTDADENRPPHRPQAISPETSVEALVDSQGQPHIFPLRVGDRVFGQLILRNQMPVVGWDQDHTLLTAIANQTALSIANARQYQLQSQHRQSAEAREHILRRREKYLSIINEISQVTLKSQDMALMLQNLADKLGLLFTADSVLITLWNLAHRQPEPVAAFGPLRQVIRTLQLEPDDLPIVGAVLESSLPLVVADSRNSPYLSARMAEILQCRSLAAVPLIADEQKLGAVILAYQSRQAINDDLLEMAEQVVRQIALAIAKNRALQSAQDRAQELAALQKATAALLSTLDLDALLGQILDASISAIPAAKKGRLHLIARETGQLQIRATQGYLDPRINAVRSTDLGSHPAQAVRERRPLLVHDVQTAPASRLQAELPEVRAIAAMVVAPLLRGDEVLGAISLEAYTRYAFTEADLDLLVSFAATATTAIHNAQMHAAVQKEAITDTLTGLYNRRGFFEFGWREVERAHRFAHPLSVVLFDLDNFKQVNDRYGHLTGDRVLAGLAALLKRELRQIDLVGRYGGDEFILLLPETDCANAQQAAERLRHAAENFAFSEGYHPVRVTTSAGVASLQQPGETLEQLIERADQALYQAKSSGRNRVLA